MKKPAKQYIHARVDRYIDLSSGIRPLIEQLNSVLELEKEGWKDLDICYDSDYEEHYIQGMRLENDKEYNARIKRLEKDEKKIKLKEQKEKDLYEKLKKKYGGK